MKGNPWRRSISALVLPLMVPLCVSSVMGVTLVDVSGRALAGGRRLAASASWPSSTTDSIDHRHRPAELDAGREREVTRSK